jgi:hypothetical protein
MTDPASGAGGAPTTPVLTTAKNVAPALPAPEKREPAYGAWVVTAGLTAIVVVFVASVLSFSKASDVASATAGVSGVIAALVGAYFGVRGSTLAQQQASKSSEEHPGGK